MTLCLTVGACGSNEDAPQREKATAIPTPQAGAVPTPTEDGQSTVGPHREWVAVFRVAEIEELETETQDLLRLVPENIAVSPVSCWPGLPEKLGNPKGESVYVSAVVAESRQELDRVVQKVGREPILVGEFPATCVD